MGFEEAVEDASMVAYFSALGLEIADVKSLFVLLDRDQTGSIDIEEFLVGCLRLRGEARSLDLAKLQFESEWMVQSLENLTLQVRYLVGDSLPQDNRITGGPWQIGARASPKD